MSGPGAPGGSWPSAEARPRKATAQSWWYRILAGMMIRISPIKAMAVIVVVPEVTATRRKSIVISPIAATMSTRLRIAGRKMWPHS